MADRRFLVGCVVVLATVMLVAESAGAATIPVQRSDYGAGYRSDNGGAVSSARTQFVVPTVTCAHDNDLEILSIGLLGDRDGVLSSSVAKVFVRCVNSFTPEYLAEASAPGDTMVRLMPVSVGDVVVVRLNETSTSTTATVHDVTAKTVIHSTGAREQDNFVLVGDSGYPDVPTFSKIHFSRTIVNGVVLANATPLTREVMTFNEVLVTTTVVADNSGGFTTVFRNNT